jgi:hypothetical protein
MVYNLTLNTLYQQTTLLIFQKGKLNPENAFCQPVSGQLNV